MRSLDRNYLSTHTSGSEKAVVSLSVAVPTGVDVPANPDGTRPRITLNATGVTYTLVLAALQHLHEDGDGLLQELIADVVTDEDLEAFSSLEEAAPLLTERVHAVTSPFRTFEWSAELTLESADGRQEESSVDFELISPSLGVGVPATVAMTTPQMLTNVAISFSPKVEDDDDYERNEVLVVS
ncbi:hypothetical protein IV500_04795 [Paeniglutamicibacter antarcticus]|uniref:Uncharacterized protein n=1 Tax=Arthrobacter terrae TaxID=2935737 RepID=A0A931CPP6_9MICC|nr:hypothetical protein [Arthrobacter terrae]MBG0738736.1 hypothetical protein [Arthrobacter terrae]